MAYSDRDVLNFIYENDVKFIKLAFCDVFGVQKNISVTVDQIGDILNNGYEADLSPIKGFESTSGLNTLLFPDPNTLHVLPWRPQQGRVVRLLCDIKDRDGNVIGLDPRHYIKKAIQRCEALGVEAQIGLECDFYLFKTDEAGEPTPFPHDEGGYFDIAPLDKGENVRREICLCLEEMGIAPQTSHHEQGPGQHEIGFLYSGALTAADNFLTFKTVVKAMAARNGLFASFMPQPLDGRCASALNINIVLLKDGQNLFLNRESGMSEQAESFAAGILEHAAEMTAFMNPVTNSYSGLERSKAPRGIACAIKDGESIIRARYCSGGKAGLNYRAADPAINPYIAFALLLEAGLDGIERKLKLNKPDAGAPKLLPGTLAEALNLASKSEFLQSVLGVKLCSAYLEAKSAELAEYEQAEDKVRYESKKFFRVM